MQRATEFLPPSVNSRATGGCYQDLARFLADEFSLLRIEPSSSSFQNGESLRKVALGDSPDQGIILAWDAAALLSDSTRTNHERPAIHAHAAGSSTTLMHLSRFSINIG